MFSLAISVLGTGTALAAESLRDSVYGISPSDEVHDCTSGLVLLFPLEVPFRQWVTLNEDVCDPARPLRCEAIFEISESNVPAELYRIDDLGALDLDLDGTISSQECQQSSNDIIMLVPATLIATGEIRYQFQGHRFQEDTSVLVRYNQEITGTMIDLTTNDQRRIVGLETGTVLITFSPFSAYHEGHAERIIYSRGAPD